MNNRNDELIVYMSVSNFAKKVKVSRQTIYNRLDTDLAEFVKVDSQTGRKTIDIRALSLFDTLHSIDNKGDINM